MRPKLFKINDLLLMWVPALIIGVLSYAMIQSHISKVEQVPWQGWLVSGLVVFFTLLFVVMFYYNRYQFNSMWKYKTKHGINCYFESNTSISLKLEVEAETEKVISRFINHFSKSVSSSRILNNITCIFKSQYIFTHYQPGYAARRVYGVAGYKWIEVGKGKKKIGATAFAHEIAHQFLPYYMKTTHIDEKEAHEIFKKMGL